MKTAASISSVIASAKASNNGRLNSMAMTQAQIRCAEKAVSRGLMKMWHADFPGFGYVKLFSIV